VPSQRKADAAALFFSRPQTKIPTPRLITETATMLPAIPKTGRIRNPAAAAPRMVPSVFTE